MKDIHENITKEDLEQKKNRRREKKILDKGPVTVL